MLTDMLAYRIRKTLVAAATAVLLCLGVARSQAAPSSLLISTNRTEPTIALGPHSPSRIVTGTNTTYGAAVGGAYPVASFTSQKGGGTFCRGVVPPPQAYGPAADRPEAVAGIG